MVRRGRRICLGESSCTEADVTDSDSLFGRQKLK